MSHIKAAMRIPSAPLFILISRELMVATYPTRPTGCKPQIYVDNRHNVATLVAMTRSYRYLLNLLLNAGLPWSEAHQIATEQANG